MLRENKRTVLVFWCCLLHCVIMRTSNHEFQPLSSQPANQSQFGSGAVVGADKEKKCALVNRKFYGLQHCRIQCAVAVRREKQEQAKRLVLAREEATDNWEKLKNIQTHVDDSLKQFCNKIITRERFIAILQECKKNLTVVNGAVEPFPYLAIGLPLSLRIKSLLTEVRNPSGKSLDELCALSCSVKIW